MLRVWCLIFRVQWISALQRTFKIILGGFSGNFPRFNAGVGLFGITRYNPDLLMPGRERLTPTQEFKKWDRIFDGINKGLTADKIYEIEADFARHRIARRAEKKRGEESERYFIEAVENLDYVVEIKRTKKNSDEDYRLKVDAWVICEFEDYGVMTLAVQVKSSQVGVRDFLQRYIDKDIETAWKKVHDYGMVVISCQTKPIKIQGEFLNQIKLIQAANPRS